MRVAKVFVVALLVATVFCFFLSFGVKAEEQEGSDSVLVAEGGITSNQGVSFSVPVEVVTSNKLAKISMKLYTHEKDFPAFDSFTYEDTLLLPDTRDTVYIQNDTTIIDLWHCIEEMQGYMPPGRHNFANLWFTGIKNGEFLIDSIYVIFQDSVGVWKTPDDTVLGSIIISYYADPDSADFFDSLTLIKEKEDLLTNPIGVKAKIPIPFSAWNSEILSGFHFPFVIKGTNLPSYDKITFEHTALLDTVIDSLDTSYWKKDSALIKLEIKKALPDTLLFGHPDSLKWRNLFYLWVTCDDDTGSWMIYPDTLPRFGPLFFIDNSGGFVPAFDTLSCSTFDYVPGDVNANERVSNVDLCHLAEYLLEPSSSSSYDRVSSHTSCSHNLLMNEPALSDSQIRFRGDVNGDTCVDAGDMYYLSRFLQATDAKPPLYGWSNPTPPEVSECDTLRIVLPIAYPGAKRSIRLDMANPDSISAFDIPLILDISKVRCYSASWVGERGKHTFDWDELIIDFNLDGDSSDILVFASTVGEVPFPYIDSGSLSPVACLYCSTIGEIDFDSFFIDTTFLAPSHLLKFFKADETGYSISPKCIIEYEPYFTLQADYGDAPDGRDLLYSGYKFPSLYDIERCGPFHKDTELMWLGGFSDTTTTECNAKIEDMDNDSSGIVNMLYTKQDTGYWVAPVSVKGEADDTVECFLNVLFDVERDTMWDTLSGLDWVVRNKLLRIPSNSTQNVVLGPSLISQPPDSEIPTSWAWARFTLTKDSLILEDSIWGGTGPDTGFAYGETEDIYFKSYTDPKNIALFVIKQIPDKKTISGSDSIGVEIHNVGKIIFNLVLRPEVLLCPGECDSVIISPEERTIPGPLASGVYDTIYFDFEFLGKPNDRVCEVLYKLSYKNLVATDIGEIEEEAAPYFVFLNPSDDLISWADSDTTISYYGGVIDLRFSVVDPDSDYPVTVTFDRSEFSDAVYDPIFADSKVKSVDTVHSPSDTRTFYWAADPADIGTWTAIFTAKDSEADSSETTLTFTVTDDTTLLPPNKVWVGREGIIESPGDSIKVAVEVFNVDSLEKITLPFKIKGDVSYLLDTLMADPECRLYSDSVLGHRETDPDTFPQPHPETIKLEFTQVSGQYGLSPSFGKLFYLIFQSDSETSFEIDTTSPIIFEPEVGVIIDTADFESHSVIVKTKTSWYCGDVTCDNLINISDVIYLANYLLKGGPPPCPVILAGDINCDGKVNLSDVIYLANYLLKGGPPPQICHGCVPKPEPPR